MTREVDEHSVAQEFSEEGRKFLSQASTEARHLNHAYVGTEHLLLALARNPEGPGATALRELGVDLGDVEARVSSVIGRDRDKKIRETPLTPRSKRILSLAESEARRRNAAVDSSDVLFAMVREGEGIAAQILSMVGVIYDPDRGAPARVPTIRDWVKPDGEAKS